MYARAVEGPPRCAAGEVIPEVAMSTAEEAPASLIWNDIETERDGIFFLYKPKCGEIFAKHHSFLIGGIYCHIAMSKILWHF